MMDFEKKKQHLETLNDSEWFNEVCELFSKENNIQVLDFMKIFGNTNDLIEKDKRGSKFLIPFDKRFKNISINPDIENENINSVLESCSFVGSEFCLKKSLILDKFKTYQTIEDYQTESTNLLFENIPSEYNFKQVIVGINIEIYDFNHEKDYVFHYVKFRF